MRYFVSTGEASGELSGVLLAQAMRAYDPTAHFEGIGSERMREAGFSVIRDHRGWASMGPIAAIPRIPKLLKIMWDVAAHIVRTQPDLVILVDFGAFNVRLAKELRTKLGYRGAILYLFPPATWLDNEKRAREVSAYTIPMTAFEHQYHFYKLHHLPIVYFGHPLAAQYRMRDARPAAPPDGGTIALLPGSRSIELRYHVPVLIEAFRLLKAERPQLRAVFGAAGARVQKDLLDIIERLRIPDMSVVEGLNAAIEGADAALVASGTAVLETTLSGVPSVAYYIISKLLARHARRVFSGKYFTLPNLVTGSEIVPEFFQERATPAALAQAAEAILKDPAAQYGKLAAFREALGATDALERCARFAVALATTGKR